MRLNDLIKQVCAEAVVTWGAQAQLCKASEEATELANAVNHYDGSMAAREKILDEMVDCGLMIEQLKMLLEVTPAELLVKQKFVIASLQIKMARHKNAVDLGR